MRQKQATEVELDTPMNANWFKRLGNFLSNNLENDNRSSQRIKSKQEDIISQKVDELLKNEMYDIVMSIQESGYTLNPIQDKKMDEGFYKTIQHSFSPGLKLLAKAINSSYPLKEKHLLDFFFSIHLHSFVYTQITLGTENEKYWKDITKEEQTIYPVILDKIQDKEFVRHLFEKWMGHIEQVCVMKNSDDPNSYYHKNVLDPFLKLNDLNASLLFSQASLDEYLGVIDKLEKIPLRPLHLTTKTSEKFGNLLESSSISRIVYLMKNNMNAYMEDQIQEFKKHTQEVFSVEYLENQTKKATIRLAQHVDLTKLSTDTLTILNEIKTKFALIDIKEMDVQTKTNFDNLQQQRLPEILQKYFSIHEEYRDTLHDSKGKTPTTLMKEALLDIKEIVNDIVLMQQEEKHKALTVEREMTSEYKKRF